MVEQDLDRVSSCCDAAAQEQCCDTADEDGCCTPQSETCGCSAVPAASIEIRERVRERYAAAATEIKRAGDGARLHIEDREGRRVFGGSLYGESETNEAPVAASLGCGVPTAVADLAEGETVLDLGSGAGADVLISARRVGPHGRAIGLDMTDEMLELARRSAREAGIENVEFLKGFIEDIPLAGDSVDVVISNCVLNLSGDKTKVIHEAARVLRPGGRFAISDVIADADMDEATRADMRQWTGCIAGALTEAQFEDALAAAGFVEVEIRETHRVHEHAGAAIIRATKPFAGSAPSCALDSAELDEQLARYRRIGLGARRIEHSDDRLVVELAPDVDAGEVESAIAIERECCPFFALSWEPSDRRLAISISEAQHAPALDAIASALDPDG